MDDITIEILKNYIIDNQISKETVQDITITMLDYDYDEDFIYFDYKVVNDSFEYGWCIPICDIEKEKRKLRKNKLKCLITK